MKVINHLIATAAIIGSITVNAQDTSFKPITERVNVQGEIAPPKAIIDNEWVAVGTKKKHAIGYDSSVLFDGKPSYRFTLLQEDNTLEGYSEGETKGRAEFSYCYATADDVKKFTPEEYNHEVVAKTVYHNGKGYCAQGSLKHYRFSVYIPKTLSDDVSTIFAQWHGMPDRTLLQMPDGTVKKITKAEFAKLCETMSFKKNEGVDLATKKKNGWLVEQGGYPPLAFGFSGKYFYIKANSDRKWLSDKTDRCNIGVEKSEIMKPQKSTYKASTIAYKMPFADFPKETWITFDITIQWTIYGKEKETIEKPGMLDVQMSYNEKSKTIKKHIVDNEEILIGRNDDDGYYFKFGIYRVGNSTIPVSYNLANYKEW